MGETKYQIKLQDLATAEMKKIQAAMKAIEDSTGDTRKEFKELESSTMYRKKIQDQIDAVTQESNVLADTWAKLDPTKFAAATLLADGVKNALAGVIDFGKESVEAYLQSQQSMAKLQGVVASAGDQFGLTADDLAELGSQMQRQLGIDEELTRSAEAVLVSFHNISSDEIPRVLQASADMGQVFGDIGTAAAALGKALDNPVDGLGALSKAGVTFTDAEKKSVQAMVEANNTLGAQDLILKKVEDRFGGIAEAVGNDPSQGFHKLSLAIGEVQESFGALFAPLGELSGAFADFLFGLTSTDNSVAGLVRNNANLAASAQNVLSSVKDHNAESVITEKQYSDLIRLYPELSGQITAYGTSVEEATKKVKALNDEHKKQAEESLKASAQQFANASQGVEDSVSKAFAQWNRVDQKNALPTDLRPENLEKVRTALAQLEQRNKDSGMTLINPIRLDELKSLEHEVSNLISLRGRQKEIEQQLAEYQKSGSLTPKKDTRAPDASDPGDAARKAYELQNSWDMELYASEEAARQQALADEQAAYELQNSWDQQLSDSEEANRKQALADEQAAYELQNSWDQELQANEEAAAKEKARQLEDFKALSLNAVQELGAAWMQFSQQQIQSQIEAKEAQIQAIEDGLTEREREYEAELAIKKAAGEDTTQFEVQSLEQIKKEKLAAAQEEKKIKAEEAKLKVQAFNQQKAYNVATTIMNGATAAVKAYADLGPVFGPIGAGVIAGVTAAQIALIASQQAPALAQGGIVEATPGGQLVRVAEAGKREAVIPLDRFSEFGLGGGNGGNITVVVQGIQYQDHRELAVAINDEINRARREGHVA